LSNNHYFKSYVVLNRGISLSPTGKNHIGGEMDNSAFKVVFLAIEAASKRWTMSIRNWPQAMNQFIATIALLD
jgi:hypothetical protein